MDVSALLKRSDRPALATPMADSLFVFPLLESAHVIGCVSGTIAIIDLRLLARPTARSSGWLPTS